MKYSLDYLFPVNIWLIIFGKNFFESLLFVDYVPWTFFSIKKILLMSNFAFSPILFEALKFILAPLNLLHIFFQVSILISMLVSYHYIKKTFLEKGFLFPILFAFIFFFNPFVYSRIMIGQIGILVSYFLMPVYIYYLLNFFKSELNLNQAIKLGIAFTIVSSFSIHFFAINLLLFLVASFWIYFYRNDKRNWYDYTKFFVLFVILILLLNAFWIQGFFSNNIFSSIDSSHEEFFSPKMSQDIPAVGKIMGMWGFWREAGYIKPYKEIPVYIWYLFLAMLIFLFLAGHYYSENKKERKFFFSLFWIGLILGTGISHPYTKPFFDMLFNYLPLFNGFRDSHKFVSLIALSYAYFIPYLITAINLKLNKVFNQILTVVVVGAFILIYTFPMVGLWSQIQPVYYPGSYYEVNEFLESQKVTGQIVYFPWQTYLTYSWSLKSSSDGRISVPIQGIVRKNVVVGSDKWGFEDGVNSAITKCVMEKSAKCLEDNNIQFVLKDKCALYSDEYSFISLEPVFKSECIDIYKISDNASISEKKIPIRFTIGCLITLFTLIILISWMIRVRKGG